MNIVFSIVSHGQVDLVKILLQSMDKYVYQGIHKIKIVITENLLSNVDLKSEKFTVYTTLNLRQKGFGDNHNSAFERTESDFFFVVNPDITFVSNFNLNEVIEELVSKKIDISSPQILNPRGGVEDYKRSNLSLINLIMRKVLNKRRQKFEWLAGMFLIIKSESFRRLNGFDTDFFMYVEDCDLCMRARSLDMLVDDIPDYAVVHDARRGSTKSFKHLKWHILSLIKYWLYKKV